MSLITVGYFLLNIFFTDIRGRVSKLKISNFRLPSYFPSLFARQRESLLLKFLFLWKGFCNEREIPSANYYKPGLVSFEIRRRERYRPPWNVTPRVGNRLSDCTGLSK